LENLESTGPPLAVHYRYGWRARLAQGRAFRRAGDDAGTPRRHDDIRRTHDKRRTSQLLYTSVNARERRIAAVYVLGALPLSGQLVQPPGEAFAKTARSAAP
jgi:hypothetical protein